MREIVVGAAVVAVVAALAVGVAAAPTKPAAVVPAAVVAPAPAEAAWPIGVAVTTVEKSGTVDGVTTELSYPVFRTKPPELGKQLSAEIASWIPTLDVKTSVGTNMLSCTLVLVNRLAVIGRCKSYHDAYSRTDPNPSGGAPGMPPPYLFARWLQPGLPQLTVSQLAPGVDIHALLATAFAAMPDCRDSCALDANSFAFDADGVVFEPTMSCDSRCDELLPKIPLAALVPTNPWAKKLVAWLHKRIDAGDDFIKIDH